MKLSTLSLAAAAFLAETVSAHYRYSVLQINGQDSRDWQYIRENSNFINPMKPFLNPSNDLRCNEGSFANAGRTGVATVAPGTRLGFKLWNRGTIIHPGPTTIHMSRAPGDVKQYQGDGDWFKVYEDIICGPMNPLHDSDWCSWGKANVEFTIPADTPPGQYLVRVEHIAIHGAQSGDTEFYHECAQVEVTGNGNGSPGPMVKIPGLYNSNDPALRFFIYGAREYPYTSVGQHSVWRGGGNSGGGGTSPPPSGGGGGGGAGAGMWEQCGGQGFSGPTTCNEGRCTVVNDYYHQCT